MAKGEWTEDVRVSVKSERSITVESKCTYHPIIERSPLTIALDGEETWVRHELQDVLANATTTYLNPSLNMNATELAEAMALDKPNPKSWINNCGLNCGITEVFHLPSAVNITVGHYYRCNTTISPVTNATDPSHNLPEPFAVRAASAIGASGVIRSFGGLNSYNSAAYWSLDFPEDGADVHSAETPDTARAEFMIARFAVGTVAMMDKHASKIVAVQGNSPWIGTVLVVNWARVAAIFGGILLVQLVCGSITLRATWNVLIKEESALVTAKLLEALVEGLDGRGSVSNMKELAAYFGEEEKWRYGAVTGEGGVQKIGIVRVREVKGDSFEGVFE
jgi:hypothetical protein